MNDHIHTLVRALITVEHHVLLGHCKGAENTFLPGGHVAVGEAMTKALSRELFEELGLSSRIGSYLGAVEHTWSEGQRRQHEVNHVFAAFLEGASPAKPLLSREEHLELFWVNVAELSRYDLRPGPLVSLVQRPASGDYPPFFASTLTLYASTAQDAYLG